jgi:hypothetical protein
MSCVCILTPVVIAAWPAFSAAVVAAATSLGYQVASEARKDLRGTVTPKQSSAVNLEIPQSELVTSQLARDQRLAVTRDGVTVIFSRDERGKASLCVTGNGQSEKELRALGEQLSGRVVQQYVYQKLMGEMKARGFVVVEEETDAHQAIRMKVRHWEG